MSMAGAAHRPCHVRRRAFGLILKRCMYACEELRARPNRADRERELHSVSKSPLGQASLSISLWHSMLASFEAVLLPLVEEVRLRRAQVHNLRTAVAVLLQLAALSAIEGIGDPC